MTSAALAEPAETTRAPHPRHDGAKLRPVLSLRIRLALLVALSTAIVIGVQAYIEVRVFERGVQRDLLENARLTATAVADDYELRPDPVDLPDLLSDLHELVFSTASLRTLTIVEVTPDGPTVLASTSSGERAEFLALAGDAVRQNRTIEGYDVPEIAGVAVPVTRSNGTHAAAVATVSLGSVHQLRTKGRQVTMWFTPAAIVLLTLLVDFFTRRLIHLPIGRIRATMTRAGEGDFSARTQIVRPDEIGMVADGLNEMLRRLQDFNVALQEKVDEATAELRLKNEELVESYRGMFALREALARAEQMAAVGQLAASVAHQVGTPLNLISGYVQMMQQDETAEPRTLRRLEIVQEQIVKVASVVRTLLDQSRRRSDRQLTAIDAILGRVADLARPKLDASNIKLTIDVAPDLPPIVVDAEELELGVLNLVSNGLDAMPAGGELTIRASRDGDGVRIDVLDTGTGIASDLLPKIFDPWVTTKPAGRGTGLGLSITRDVVARHGGTITAANQPGSGALISLRLPFFPPEMHDGQNPDR